MGESNPNRRWARFYLHYDEEPGPAADAPKYDSISAALLDSARIAITNNPSLIESLSLSLGNVADHHLAAEAYRGGIALNNNFPDTSSSVGEIRNHHLPEATNSSISEIPDHHLLPDPYGAGIATSNTFPATNSSLGDNADDHLYLQDYDEELGPASDAPKYDSISGALLDSARIAITNNPYLIESLSLGNVADHHLAAEAYRGGIATSNTFPATNSSLGDNADDHLLANPNRAALNTTFPDTNSSVGENRDIPCDPHHARAPQGNAFDPYNFDKVLSALNVAYSASNSKSDNKKSTAADAARSKLKKALKRKHWSDITYDEYVATLAPITDEERQRMADGEDADIEIVDEDPDSDSDSDIED